MQTEYGNWVSRRLIYVPLGMIVICLGLSFISLFFLIGTAIFTIIMAYFIYAYYQFSARGDDIQSRVLELIMGKIDWDGNGEAIDIGCGNGALAINVAKNFPDAAVTGIDYWGAQWDYARDKCIKNAEAEGVADRIVFQKASASKLPFGDGKFDLAVSNFVFHEVDDTKDKKEVVKEALRVVKKGGRFVFQDLFLVKSIYGGPDELVKTIRSWGIENVEFINTSNEDFIPAALKLPFMLGAIGIICGTK
ncbi:MAG: class I SAM-dependent methyltransferase [Dehalococcoidia bacterium]|nr:class I SAM-dependent methyltransferase [Dehalococcoidia bacterium]